MSYFRCIGEPIPLQQDIHYDLGPLFKIGKPHTKFEFRAYFWNTIEILVLGAKIENE